MGPSLILDKLSQCPGLEGWQGWEMRKSEHLDSQTTAPCLYSRHVLESIITGPRADGQIQEYSTGGCGADHLLALMSQPRFFRSRAGGWLQPIHYLASYLGTQ